MSNDTYISFYLSTFRIHIFRKAIEEMGNPQFIRFRVHEDGTSMILETYHRKDFQSHRVPKRQVDNWKMEIRSMPLCMLLCNRLGWDENKSYRIPGKSYPQQKIVVFDLSAAEEIQKND